LILLSLLALALAAHPKEHKFKKWMATHNKGYPTQDEYLNRFQVYLGNIDLIAELNNNPYNVTYGENEFTDLTAEEFSVRLGARPSTSAFEAEPLVNAPLDGAPTAFDWCSSGHCTAVKDQGQCGSCWAFATTENIESVYSIHGKGLPDLAPQQLVDCDTASAGCGGGNPQQAYEYVVKTGGEDTESSYPYRAVRGSCKFSSSNVGAKIAGEKSGFGGSETQMAANLAATAPFSVLVDAQTWQHYSSGIMQPSQCGTSLDHAVVAAGYSMPDKYWRIRNSWGTSWGERGFIRLAFNSNTCGIRSQVLTSTL